MVDLQRRIASKANTVRGGMQADAENSDACASTEFNRREKFSATDSSENFIRYK
jgi:hypothetical protein